MTPTGETSATTSPGAAAGAEYRSVLVPLDGSELAERALGPAVWAAERFGAGVHLLAAGVSRDEQWWYGRYFDGVAARLPEATVHQSDDRDVAGAILATAADLAPCLVCMGSHGRSRSAAIVGSTFDDVAARTHAPLLAVGPHAETPAGAPPAVLVCLDGDAAAEHSLPVAAGWARRLGTRVLLVTATDPVFLPADAEEGPYGPEHDPDVYMAKVAGRPELAGLDVAWEIIWGPDAPHVGITARLAAGAAGVAVATSHARRGVARATLGSEVANIVRHSPAPVLVLPLPR